MREKEGLIVVLVGERAAAGAVAATRDSRGLRNSENTVRYGEDTEQETDNCSVGGEGDGRVDDE